MTCQCGGRFVAKPALVGKTVKCPKCSAPIQIPAPSHAETLAVDSPSDLLDDVLPDVDTSGSTKLPPRPTATPTVAKTRKRKKAGQLVVKTREAKIALGLLVIGVLLLCARALFFAGAAGAMIMLVLLLIQLVLGVSIGIAACLATGYLLGTSFGYLGEACIKLAAIFTFPMAVAVLVPGGICVMVIVFPLLYFGLLLWLFDLQFLEGFVFTLVLAGTQFLAGWLIGLFL